MPTPSQRLDDVREMWKVTVAMYLIGAATLYAVLPLPDPDPSDHGVLATIATAALVCGVFFWAAGPRRGLVKLAAVGGIVMVSILVAVAKPIGASPFFYLWPVLLAGYYLTPRQLLGALALLYIGYGGALGFSEEPDTKTVLFIGGASSFTLAAVVVNRLRQRLEHVVAQLEHTAASDPLTGLLNRRGFEAAFDRDLERARRMDAPLSLVLFDLDHFKQVNDAFGHIAGDEALQTVAGVLLDEGRAGDVVARTGGEEFAAVLLDCDLDDALAYAQRVAGSALLLDSPCGPLSLSAGIAELGGAVQTRPELLVAADRLLYAAKDAGRRRAGVQAEPVRLEPLGLGPSAVGRRCGIAPRSSPLVVAAAAAAAAGTPRDPSGRPSRAAQALSPSAAPAARPRSANPPPPWR